MSFSQRLLKVFLLQKGLTILPVAFAAQYIPVPWSSSQYGPDGPWQAVQVTVGGTSEDILIITENHQQVDLLPGGDWSTKVLTSKACEPYKDGTCGKGGTRDPNVPPSVDVKDSWVDDASGINATNLGILLQASTVSSFSQWNSSLTIVDDISVTGPDGRKRGPELGTFSLGGAEVSQKFATSETNNNAQLLGYSFPGAAYNKSQIKSFSYGLQIGSASLGYAGSLLFGGYDKARLIAPYTTFNAAPLLLDVSIGVETGGSPFNFSAKTGLLISNTSQPTTLSVLPDPRAAYLHLPRQTCEEIAQYIPITFDSTLKYWLWDTKKPEYKTIITSPSYLGFIFPPAPGSSTNVTIKVPFNLLNLTLDAPITKTPTPYFPCQDFTPASGGTYILGRAFLQAAFLGRNWNRQISWLAQAPGPGVQKAGIGSQSLFDIEDAAVDLKNVFNDSALFAQTWAPYWTPLPEAAGTKPSSSASFNSGTPTPQSSSGLSTGAKAGIGVGVTAVALLAIGFIVLFLRYRKVKRGAMEQPAPPAYTDEGKPMGHVEASELEQPPVEMVAGQNQWTYELPSATPELGIMSPVQRPAATPPPPPPPPRG